MLAKWIRYGATTSVALVTWAAMTVPPTRALANPSIQITLQDSNLSPRQFTVKKGQRVDLEITNEGTKQHNLVIPAVYIFTHNLNPGESVSASFRPDKTGAFPYYSDTGGQPEPGLRGSLTVAP